MKRFFFGFLLIFLNFNLHFNACSIDVLPDFVGYYLILKGVEELAEQSGAFVRARPFALGLTVYCVAVWLLSAVGIYAALEWFASLATLIATICMLYLSYQIISGIADMEQCCGADLRSQPMLKCWKALAAAEIAGILVGWLGNVLDAEILTIPGVLLLLVAFIATIMFAVLLYQAWKAYEALPPQSCGTDGGAEPAAERFPENGTADEK